MKKNVLDLIAESGKMPILFIGAGISKRYLYHYPDWDTLSRRMMDGHKWECCFLELTFVPWNFRWYCWQDTAAS